MTFKNKIWFNSVYLGIIKGRINEFRDYVLEVESKFQGDLKNIEAKCNKEIKKIASDEDKKQEITEFYGEDFYIIESIFLHTFRYSALVSIYSLIETSMSTLCRHLERREYLTLKLSDLKGKGVERARLYLTKVCHITFPDSSHEWSEIQKLNKVRNCIVHANGNIERVRSSDKLRSIIKDTKGLKIERKRILIIEKVYLDNAITWAENFLQKLYEESLPLKK